MPVIVVGTEDSFAALRSRLLKGRTSAKAFHSLTEAVRAANPHADLDRLQPGTVLSVPQVPGVELRADFSLDEAMKESAEAMRKVAAEMLDELVKKSESAEERGSAERREAGAVLGRREVQLVVRRDQLLAEEVKAAQTAIGLDEEVSARRRESVAKARDFWSAELDALAREWS